MPMVIVIACIVEFLGMVLLALDHGVPLASFGIVLGMSSLPRNRDMMGRGVPAMRLYEAASAYLTSSEASDGAHRGKRGSQKLSASSLA
jgi:hypothetical protein